MDVHSKYIHEQQEEDLFARSLHRPNTQPTASNDPFQSRQNPVVAEVHIIKVEVLAIRPQWMELQVLVLVLVLVLGLRRRPKVLIEESS